MLKPQANTKPETANDHIDLSGYCHTLRDPDVTRVSIYHSIYDFKHRGDIEKRLSTNPGGNDGDSQNVDSQHEDTNGQEYDVFESVGPTADIWEVWETGDILKAILAISDNHHVVLDQLNKYANPNTSLTHELLSAITWRTQNFLHVRLRTLQETVERIPDELLDLTEKHGNNITVYDMFKKARTSVKSLLHILSLKQQNGDFSFNETDPIPLRAPETILIAIALESQYEPSKKNLEKLCDPKTALGIDFTPKPTSLREFATQKAREDWVGAPATHHVTISENPSRWVVGSTASRLHRLKGAQDMLKKNRKDEMGDYADLMIIASNWLAKEENEHFGNRRELIGKFRETNLRKALDRSGNLGVAFKADLTLALNCFKCEAFFSYQQVGESLFSEKARADNTEHHKFTTDGSGPEKHSCAEVVTSLQIIEAMHKDSTS